MGKERLKCWCPLCGREHELLVQARPSQEMNGTPVLACLACTIQKLYQKMMGELLK